MKPFDPTYQGTCPVKKGDKVEVLVSELDAKDEVWVKGKVLVPCAVQFTAMVAKHTLFFFYSDQGGTWKKISD